MPRRSNRLLLRLLAAGAPLFFSAGLALSASAEPLTLDQAYQAALTVSKSLKEREQSIRLAEARYRQAMAELYPEVFVVGTYRRRSSADFGSLTSGTFDDPSSGLRRSRSLGESQSEGIVTLSQPLFRGFREFILADAATAEREAFEFEQRRAEELLLLDTADLFYQVLLYDNQAEVITALDKTLSKRLVDLKEYVKLGKSRESEILAAEGDRAAQRRLIEAARRGAAVTRELFGSLLARDAQTLELQAMPDAALDVALVPLDLESLVAQAKKRTDLLASQALVRSQESLIEAEKRRYWPELTVEGNAYAADDPDRNRDWEVWLRMDAPLFEGGRIDARVGELEATRAKYDYQLQERQRVAERDVRAAFAHRQGALQEWQRSRELVSARRRNYDLQRQDYELGLVTNIDVLSALTQLQNAELDQVRSRSDIALAEVQLKVAAGGFAP